MFYVVWLIRFAIYIDVKTLRTRFLLFLLLVAERLPSLSINDLFQQLLHIATLQVAPFFSITLGQK